MITIPGNVRVWLATGHTDMRRGFRSLALMVQEELKRDPHCGDLYVFRGRRSQLPTFRIPFSFCDIAYRWHPLFGRELQVSPFRRGKELTCIYTNERPDLCRELPNWMSTSATAA